MKEYGLSQEDMDLWLKYVRDIPKKEHRRRHAKIKEPAYPAILDLHGFTLQEGFDILKNFISIHYTLKTGTVLVITGKGRTERSFQLNVPRWLREKHFDRFVSSFGCAPPDMGGEGALFVRIKKKG